MALRRACWPSCARCPACRAPSPWLRACRWPPTSTWRASASAATTGRRTTRRTSTPCRSAPATSGWWASRSSRAAPSRRRRGGRAQGGRRQRDDGAPVLARAQPARASSSTPTASRRSRTRSWAWSATTRSARWARSRGRTCTFPPGRRAVSAGRAHHASRPRRRCPCCARPILALEPDVVFTEDVPAAEVVATTVAPDAHRRGAARLVRRARAAAGRGRPLRRGRLLGRACGRARWACAWRWARARRRPAPGARPGRPPLAGRHRRSARCWPRSSAACWTRCSTASARSTRVAYAVAAAILLAVAALASLVPALAAAARVDPLRALRSE